jgi:hypothetical protein
MDKFIYLPLYCGLCNRLLPLISCLRFARLTGRKLVCHWTPNPGRCCLLYWGDTCNFSELFKPIEGIEFVDNETIYQRMGNSEFTDFDSGRNCASIVDIHTNRDIFIDRCLGHLSSIEDGEVDLSLLGNEDESLLKFLSSYKTFFKELKPVDELQERINKIKATFSSKMIGIHIRRTDGGFTWHDWKHTDKTLVERVSEWKDKGYGIFLASDDPKYEDMFGNNVIVNREAGKYNNDKTNTKNAVVDLYLLSYCDTIIGTSSSTFSMVSYILSEKSRFWNMTSDPDSIRKIEIN